MSNVCMKFDKAGPNQTVLIDRTSLYPTNGWLYWGLKPLNSLGHIMAVGDAYVFPCFLTPVLAQLFFPKPPTTFLTCFCIGERRKYAGKKIASTWPTDGRKDQRTDRCEAIYPLSVFEGEHNKRLISAAHRFKYFSLQTDLLFCRLYPYFLSFPTCSTSLSLSDIPH